MEEEEEDEEEEEEVTDAPSSPSESDRPRDVEVIVWFGRHYEGISGVLMNMYE